MIGRTDRGWLYVQMLFVPDHLRKHGIATRFLAMAEQEAKARGCRGAYLDTMNPQARDFYIKLGYSVIGELADLEGGHAITWLKKPFSL
ncbi:GNAT superfamily N-acetyltransferase [Pseudorhizobium tarimense]|uniref:GNAT superfamily N-acetyltransferase n=1 Tax=Pseudorhizobium tarimense TaxID=1079109 RepID=A0ABV2H6W6_9HYPH|nr:GNAT family N-acetyltransferase [Pseudorhizobium tarimense]MCJ8519383.1 GNAT family N-acetyltransferase [Pseudorhizobium tarimense]